MIDDERYKSSATGAFIGFVGIMVICVGMVIASSIPGCTHKKEIIDENMDMECGDSDEYRMWITGEGDTIWE